MPTYLSPSNFTGGLIGLMEYSNSVSDNLWGSMILLMVYIGTFLYFVSKGFDPAESATSCGFLTVFVGILLLLGGLIDNSTLYLAILAEVVAIGWLFFSQNEQ